MKVLIRKTVALVAEGGSNSYLLFCRYMKNPVRPSVDMKIGDNTSTFGEVSSISYNDDAEEYTVNMKYATEHCKWRDQLAKTNHIVAYHLQTGWTHVHTR